MAEDKTTIFNDRAAEKLRSPDDLEKYVRVTNPSIWAVLGACLSLLLGLLAWGVFGTVSSSVETTGTVLNGKPMSFITAEQAEKVGAGDSVMFGDVKMKVAEVAESPSSIDEVKKTAGSDHLVSALTADNWSYAVTYEGDVSTIEPEKPVSVVITTDQRSPLSLILGGRD